MFKKAMGYVPWVIVLIAVLSALWAWNRPQPQPQQEAAPMPKPKIVYRIPVGYVPVAQCRVRAYDKEKAAEITHQPEQIAKDENKQITAIGEVEPYRGTTQVTAIFDTQKGNTELYQRRLPIPLLGFDNTKHVGVIIGNGWAADAGWSFARVGNAYIGVAGAFASSAGQNVGVVGVSLRYEFF